MREILLACLIGLIGSVAYANKPFVVEKKLLCSTTESVIKSLSGPDYKEKPIWAGTDGNDRYVITANKNTKTWTILQITDGFSCIIGTGRNQSLIPFKDKSDM
jgi:hypothetical protein